MTISSKAPKFPVLSTNSFVSVFSCFNRIYGLPKHLEYIHRDDLILEVLKKILEHDLDQLPEGSQLTAVVTDFRVDVKLTTAQNCAVLEAILRLFSSRPKGNAIHFSQVFYYPKHCKLPQMQCLLLSQITFLCLRPLIVIWSSPLAVSGPAQLLVPLGKTTLVFLPAYHTGMFTTGRGLLL